MAGYITDYRISDKVTKRINPLTAKDTMK